MDEALWQEIVLMSHWVRDSHPWRFNTELGRLTGADDPSGAPDLDAGFEALCEATEITALQRGCARWAPGSA